MKRRELLRGLAGAGVTPSSQSLANDPARYGARGDGVADDTAAWRNMVAVNGCHAVPDGIYRITAKVQTSAFLTIIGTTRQNTVLVSAGFRDHLLEVGNRDSGPNPNVGSLQRLRFMGGRGTPRCCT